MSRAKRVFSPEFREDAVRLVIDSSRPIASVARELQIGEGTLGNWVSVYRREHVGEEPGLDVGERARLRELERRYREVKLENEFLKKPQRTSPRIPGEREVRVRRHHAHRTAVPVPCSVDVPLAGRVRVGVLFVAGTSGLGDRPAPRRRQSADHRGVHPFG